MTKQARIVVLRHVECEHAATFADVLSQSATVDTVDLGIDRLPRIDEVDAVISMGGPMGVNDRDTVGWIDSEIAWLRDAVGVGKPVLGVCLGAQLLAAALGARVYKGSAPEVGVMPVSLTEAGRNDPVLGHLPEDFTALEWHGDTFDIPEGAQRLAFSHHYRNQAFRQGNALGVQFHLEAPAALVEQWSAITEYADALHATLGDDGVEVLNAQMAEAGDTVTANAVTFITAWRDHHLG